MLKDTRQLIRFFLFLRHARRPHSSMDRIKDSGSFDLGSNPGGVTFRRIKAKPVNDMIYRFFLNCTGAIPTSFLKYLLKYRGSLNPMR